MINRIAKAIRKIFTKKTIQQPKFILPKGGEIKLFTKFNA